MCALHSPCVPGAGGETAASAELGLTWPFGHSQSHSTGGKTRDTEHFRTNPLEITSVAIHREGPWTEGAGPRRDPACSRSPGGVAAPASVLGRRWAELSPNASGGGGLPLCRLCLRTPGLFFPRVQFPCNALTSNRGKQQSSGRRSRLGEARGEQLSHVKTGKSRQQPWRPAPKPPGLHVSIFLPLEACSKSGACPAAGSPSRTAARRRQPPCQPRQASPIASPLRRGRRDRGPLAAPFPGQRDLQLNKQVWVSGGVKSSRWGFG